jgi:Undecaprenyl-phosphate glucose phosphotransferase
MSEIDNIGKDNRDAARKRVVIDDVPLAPVELRPVVREIAMHLRKDVVSPVMVTGIVRLTEFALFLISGAVVLLIYVGLQKPVFFYYLSALLLVPVLTSILIEMADGYQIPALRNPLRFSGKLISSWAATFALLAVTAFFLKISDSFSRVWLAGWFGSGLACSAIMRVILARFVRRWGRNGIMERRAVIVGGGERGKKLIRALEAQKDNDIRICGVFDDRSNDRSPPIIAGYPKLGTVSELVEFARLARVDMLIISLPLTAEKRVLTLLKKLWVLPVDVRLSALSNQLRFRPRAYSHIGGVAMLDIFDRPISNWDSVAKRAFDIFFSSVGIILLSPVMLVTALAIKLESRGPVFFRQERHGFNNEIVDVLKFRSMYTDKCDPTARATVVKGDPRVTRVGRIIRKTSIDELPQFFNVFSGKLSLVGPRPHAVYALAKDKLYHEVVDGYFARHRVKPGVTGWAQINGWRGEVDKDVKIQKRTEFDLYYIENWSLLFDLKILFLTPIRLLNTENAY